MIVGGTGTMQIRQATADDDDAIWEILEPILRAGEVFAWPRQMSRRDALRNWSRDQGEAFVAFDDEIQGTFYLRANQAGGGGHVANAGFATARGATGRGIAALMCHHAIEHAVTRGFTCMQFNFVVGTNTRALELWQRLGFAIVGRLPGAFIHPRLGAVDALVMFRRLV